jgi:hypothetical protein
MIEYFEIALGGFLNCVVALGTFMIISSQLVNSHTILVACSLWFAGRLPSLYHNTSTKHKENFAPITASWIEVK